MSEIYKYQFTWSGFPGGPGVSTLYGVDDTVINGAAHTLFNAIALRLPPAVTITFPSTVEVLDDADGSVQSMTVPDTVPAPVTGGTQTQYVAPAGLVAEWLTDGFVGSRRVIGKTFFVPYIAPGLGGAPFPTDRTALVNAASAFVTACAGKFVVWSRPRKAQTAAQHPPDGVTARAGTHFPVVGSRVPNEFVVLRSRRD